MLVLLQISRNREGAGALLDAGLVSAIRDSTLFQKDADLGIPVPSSSNAESSTSSLPSKAHSAMRTYYTLVASTLRALLSTFLSRGPHNEQIQYQARAFLTDNRAHMVGIFKKHAGVTGKVDEMSISSLAECVRCYTGLAALCGFVDVSIKHASLTPCWTFLLTQA